MGEARLTYTDYSKDWPMFLKQAKDLSKDFSELWEPILVNMDLPNAEKRLKELIGAVSIDQIIDNYDEQLAELFVSKNAHLYKERHEVKVNSISDFLIKHYGRTHPWEKGSWVYYSWNQQLVHVLEEDLFNELRTIRNKDLINQTEQDQFRNFKVGCAGMSIGSNGAIAITIQGGSHQIKLADGAVISGSNLNRIRANLSDVGLEKSLVIARQIYEMDPYAEVQRHGRLNISNVKDFFENWSLDLVVDEIDDLPTKVILRMEAKKRGIPVVMVTEPGDDIMLDVERFDLDPSLPIFHGMAGNIEEVLGKKEINQREFMKYAMDIIGISNTPLRAQKSLLKVGSTLPTHPQLGGTAMFAGSAIAFAVRQISYNGPLKSGRHTMSFEQSFLNGYTGFRHRMAHRKHTKLMTKAMRQI